MHGGEPNLIHKIVGGYNNNFQDLALLILTPSFLVNKHIK